MALALKPEVQRLIDDQVRAGRFATPEAVVESAILDKHGTGEPDLDDGAGEIDADLQTSIDESRAQLDRGEGIDFEEFKAHWEKKLRGT